MTLSSSQKIIFLFGFIFLSFITFSQISQIDSLKSLLENYDKNNRPKDTTYINILNDLSFKLIGTNPDTALILANQSLKLLNQNKIFSKQEKWKKLSIASSYNIIGIIYANLGNYDKTIEFFSRALKIREEIGDKKGMASSYNNTGNIYEAKGNYDKAIEFYSKALKIHKEIGNKQGMAAAYKNIGFVHANKGNYDQAIEFYFKTTIVREKFFQNFISLIFKGYKGLFSHF